jgi:hypothetical protein
MQTIIVRSTAPKVIDDKFSVKSWILRDPWQLVTNFCCKIWEHISKFGKMVGWYIYCPLLGSKLTMKNKVLGPCKFQCAKLQRHWSTSISQVKQVGYLGVMNETIWWGKPSNNNHKISHGPNFAYWCMFYKLSLWMKVTSSLRKS